MAKTPGVPRTFTVKAADASAALTWQAPSADGGSAIKGYSIFRDGVFIGSTGAVLAYTATGLTNGRTYRFAVAAFNAVGGGTHTADVTVTPVAPITVPGVPQGLICIAGDGQASLAWGAPLTDGGDAIEGYNVFRNGTFVESIAGTAYTATGLANGTTYRFAVSAWNSAGGGAHTADVAVTPKALGPAPFGDLPGWRLRFSDEFGTDIPLGQFQAASAGRYFCYQKGWHDTSGNGVYSPEIIEVKDGVLNIHIDTDPATGQRRVAAFVPITNGMIDQYHARGLTGARFLIRMRADALAKYKAVPMLWSDAASMSGLGDAGKWIEGEIDGPEANLDGQPKAYMHYTNVALDANGKPTETYQEAFSTPAGTTWQEWHEYVTEWRAGESVEYFLDGKSYGKCVTRVPTTAMHMNAQFETQVSSIAPDPATAGLIQIDRLAVWEQVA